MSAVNSTDAGHGERVERLFRRHRVWLIDFLTRRFGSSVGEDAAQEAFVRTLASRSQIRNPRAFLIKVAIRAALEEVSRRPEPRFVVEPVRPTAAVDAEAAVLLEQTILLLPEPLRATFLMSRFGGLSNPEIAQRLGISVKRVEARLTEARRRCAAVLQD